MTTPINPTNQFTPFLESTYNIPEEADRLRPYLNDKLSQISDVVNDKVIGAWTQSASSQNGRKYFYDTTSRLRNGMQFLARIESYPAAGSITLPVPKEMSSQFVVFQVWGSASKPPTSMPGTGDFFSFFGSGNPKITFTMTDQDIVITTVGLGTGYSGYICVDFIPDGI